jgi:type IV pilus assembly protein PilA
MFLQNLRAKVGARLSGDREAGFTLIELLVVMLILGILAAIAIPSFFNQREKANDAQAKAMARTAQTAVETYATDNDGSYAGVEPADLPLIEETISTTVSETDPYVSAASAGEGGGYTVTVTSPVTGNTFSITRNGAGVVSYTCNTGGNAGCPTGGEWD